MSDGREAVGRVLGTEDATPLSYWVGIADGQYLQLDDVVVTERLVAGREQVQVAGVVTQVRARHEGARFDSDVFLIEDGVLPASTVEAAEVTTTRVEPEVFVPPLPGAAVRRADGKERDAALSFDRMDHRLPAGIGRDGRAVYLNLDFLDGTRGAHVNISGISGVATKTSYATFLLFSLFRSGALGKDALNTKALIFNVKGEDLLFLDQPNVRFDDFQAERYRTLDLEPGPFESVSVYAPPRKGDRNGRPDVASRSSGVSAYYWTIAEFCREELLPFVFADSEDDRQQYTMIVHNVTTVLKREGAPAGDDGAWKIDGEVVRTYEELVELVVDRVENEETQWQWAGRATSSGTVNAFVRRLVSSKRTLAHLVRADIALRNNRRPSESSARVTVVDLHNLPDRAKRFVVGVTIRQAFDDKESRGSARPLLFVVLDELNKYAPREGTSPIKEILLDVAERGRSLGIILIGAQQTASEVERRVIANSAIRVVGRLDPAEAGRPEYGFLPPVHRQRATIARPGTMFVNQPEIPIPLVVEFPFPAWATRPGEVAAGGVAIGSSGVTSGDSEGLDDPFADL
ncbi:MAG: ATP-binding protein [Acidimicrobiia bacterium]